MSRRAVRSIVSVEPRCADFIGGSGWRRRKYRMDLAPATADPIAEVANSAPEDAEFAWDAATRRRTPGVRRQQRSERRCAAQSLIRARRIVNGPGAKSVRIWPSGLASGTGPSLGATGSQCLPQLRVLIGVDVTAGQPLVQDLS